MALEKNSGERACDLWWTDLTICDVSASPEAVMSQIHAKEMSRSPDNGLVICIRCDGRSRRLYVKTKNDVPYGRWPKNPHE